MKLHSMQKGQKYNSNLRYDIIIAFLLLCGLGLYIYRLPYGMADIDETFYLSIPYRLCQGDALLADEWHLSQLAGFLLYPLMQLYLKIIGTTEGIVLIFRYFYLVFQLAVSVGIYCLLRRYRLAAVGAALIFFMFTPFNIMALSYNSMGIAFGVLFCLFFFAAGKHRPFTYWLSGFFYACFVLCNPYCIIFYVLYICGCLTAYMLKRYRKSETPPFLLWKNFFIFTGGAAVIAGFFAILLFRRTSVSEILANLPDILTDPAHPAKTWAMIKRPVETFIKKYLWFVLPAVILPLLAYFDKNKSRRTIYFLLSVTVSSAAVYCFAVYKTTGLGMNAVMLPFAAIGLAAYACTPAEKRKKRALLGWFAGVIYAVCMILSSNQYMFVASNAMVISDVFAFILLAGYLDNTGLKNSRHIKASTLTVLIALQLGAQVYVKMNHVFWDEPIARLTETVAKGPVKGIRTSKYRTERYLNNLEDLDLYFSDAGGRRVHFFRNMPYAYLYTNTSLGAYSAWGSENSTLDAQKLENYYALHPDNVPEQIYVEAQVAGEMDYEVWKNYADTHGYTLEALPSGALLYQKQ